MGPGWAVAGMRGPGGRGDAVVSAPAGRAAEPAGVFHLALGRECGVEDSQWAGAGLDLAGARFLMLAAVTCHRFAGPAWGEREAGGPEDGLAGSGVLAGLAASGQGAGAWDAPDGG